MVIFEDVVEKMIQLDKCKKEDKDLIIYGLIMGFEAVANFITLVLMGIAFNLVVEGIVFYISFSAIRTYAGGYHCKKGINCYISSSCIMVLFYTVLKLMPFEYMGISSVGLLIISVPIILKFAPVATSNNPMNDVERGHFRKKVILNLIMEVVAICILFLVNWVTYAFIISLGVFVSSILLILQKLEYNFKI